MRYRYRPRPWPYHVWKDMAPLKPASVQSAARPCLLTMSEKTWLHWSPALKRGIVSKSTLTMSEKTWLHWSSSHFYGNHLLHTHLPCLKRHGSIEARCLQWISVNGGRLTMSEKTWLHWSITQIFYTDLRTTLPCLKRHGSIEAWLWRRMSHRFPLLLPCLKRHGSIEAGEIQATNVWRLHWLTMSEKTWLHWSL